MKIAIIGSGISGLSVAQLLHKTHTVSIFEKAPDPGGLIKCKRVNDCLFHTVGGHVFNAKNPDVFNWFWSFFDKENEFVKSRRNAKIFIDGKLIGYPIENNIYNFDKLVIKKILSEQLQLVRERRKSPFEYDNFSSFLQSNFGETLYELYFKPYNEKIWQTDLNTVSMEWLEDKLPMPDLQQMLMSNIVREEEGEMVHAEFYYPRENGSQFIVDRLKKGLHIQYNINIEDFDFYDNKIIINNSHFDVVIYCGDVRKLPSTLDTLLSGNGIDIFYLKNLRSNGTSNLFCETDETEISWLYIPEPFTKAHRIIYTGNFSETNNRGSKRKTCVVEFSGRVEYGVMTREITKLPGNLTPLAFNYEPNSYVIQDKQTRKHVSEAKKVLEDHHIYLLGRFAEWEYYNMDKAMEAAFKLQGHLTKKSQANYH